jgi:hypothetical protein
MGQLGLLWWRNKRGVVGCIVDWAKKITVHGKKNSNLWQLKWKDANGILNLNECFELSKR